MKLTKSFRCVPDGAIYPIELQPGDDCPPEHEQSARAQGCLDAAAPAKTKPARGGASPSASATS